MKNPPSNPTPSPANEKPDNVSKKPIILKASIRSIDSLGVPKTRPFKSQKDKKSSHSSKFLRQVLISNKNVKANNVTEKIIKGIIYLALRLVIKPSRWRESDKVYEIIDQTYRRIMSADFIYIPSSLAFYIIMAFMPIISLIMFFNSLSFLKPILEIDGTEVLPVILGKFIPGITTVLSQVSGAISGNSGVGAAFGGYVAIIFSLFITTWIASGGFAKLVFTQSHIYGHKFVGGYWMNRLKGLVMVALFTFYLIFALGINVGFEHLWSVMNLSSIVAGIFRFIFLIFGLFFLIFFGFAILYRYSPRFQTKWRWIMPGVITSSIPTAGFLILFGIITSLWDYSRFGVLGAIMYIGMASLIITYFIFVGILVNAGYHHAFIGRVHKKFTFSKK